jgi:hypothetical protein
MTRRLTAVGTGLVVVVLAVCSAAAAHGGGGALGFRSTVTGVEPAATGLSVTILDSDDRILLRNETGEDLVVLGYQGEPYLAFRDGRVYRNASSPATYLNDDRFGNVELPAEADPKGEPRWVEVSQAEAYEWHDHRIHWMSKDLPPKVKATSDQAQHVFDWKVPATLDGHPLVIAGSLDYEPPPSGVPRVLLGALVAVGVGGALAIFLRRRRK